LESFSLIDAGLCLPLNYHVGTIFDVLVLEIDSKSTLLQTDIQKIAKIGSSVFIAPVGILILTTHQILGIIAWISTHIYCFRKAK
jgi:uncharacterized membrane protein YobD (UPF0266 family)